MKNTRIYSVGNNGHFFNDKASGTWNLPLVYEELNNSNNFKTMNFVLLLEFVDDQVVCLIMKSLWKEYYIAVFQSKEMQT